MAGEQCRAPDARRNGRLGRPAVVFASGGRAATMLGRETLADMMQLDVRPSRPEDS